MRTNTLLVSIFFIVGCGATQVNSPNQAVPTIPILDLAPPSTQTLTSEAAGTVFGKLRCDESGNIYVRSAHPGGKDLLSSPVLKLGRDGSVTRFDTAKSPGFETAVQVNAFAFAIDPSGARVYVIARVVRDRGTPIESYLVTFDRDGTFRTKTAIDPTYDVRSLAVLPNGQLFMSGEEAISSNRVASANGESRRSFTGVFDSSGTLLRSLKREDDDKHSAPLSRTGATYNPVVVLGDTLVGADGYIYLLKPTSPPTVQVFTQAGELIRELSVRTPLENATVNDMVLAPGRILLKISGRAKETAEGKSPNESLYGIYTTNGEPIAFYRHNKIHGTMACYSSNEFMFFTIAPENRYSVFRVPLPR